MATNKPFLKFSRRSFLGLTGLGGITMAAYSYFRGIRFPTLSWEHKELKNTFSSNSFDAIFQDLIHTLYNDTDASFRAYAPEPKIQIALKGNESLVLVVNNIAVDAELRIESGDPTSISEQIQGISRRITLSSAAQETVILQWRLPVLDNYSFAAIGDSGGDKELDWCIQRAHQLGARFLLHLGDFNYQPGDYDNAIRLFNEAPLPCYVSIGNHDFNESGLVYEQFLQEIGPLNHYFSIGSTRFINLDTAASIVPAGGGQRGQIMKELLNDQTLYKDNVVFTHRPLHDPMPENADRDEGSHDIGSDGERDWLLANLNKIGAKTMLCGHIHIFNRSNYQGIDSIIVGQGLGHQDLLMNEDVSKMAIGQVDSDGQVGYEFAPLAMPMELHCHPRVQEVKDSIMHLPHADAIREIDAACSKDL